MITAENVVDRLFFVAKATLDMGEGFAPMLSVDRTDGPIAVVSARDYEVNEQGQVLIEMTFLGASARGDTVGLALDAWVRSFDDPAEGDAYEESGVRPSEDPNATDALIVYAASRNGDRIIARMKYRRDDDGTLIFGEPERAIERQKDSPILEALDICLNRPPDNVSLLQASSLLTQLGHTVVLFA